MGNVVFDTNVYYTYLGLSSGSLFPPNTIAKIMKVHTAYISSIALAEAICRFGKCEPDLNKLQKCVSPVINKVFRKAYHGFLPVEDVADLGTASSPRLERIYSANHLNDIQDDINHVWDLRIRQEASFGRFLTLGILGGIGTKFLNHFFCTNVATTDNRRIVDLAQWCQFMVIRSLENVILSDFEAACLSDAQKRTKKAFQDATRKSIESFMSKWILLCLQHPNLRKCTVNRRIKGMTFEDLGNLNADEILHYTKKKDFKKIRAEIMRELSNVFRSAYTENTPEILVNIWTDRIDSFLGEKRFLSKNDILDNLCASFIDLPAGILTEDGGRKNSKGLRLFLSRSDLLESAKFLGSPLCWSEGVVNVGSHPSKPESGFQSPPFVVQ